MSSSKRMVVLSAVLLTLIVAWFVSSQKTRSESVPISEPKAAAGVGFSEGASKGAEQFAALSQRVRQAKSAQNLFNPESVATPRSSYGADSPGPVVLPKAEPVKIPKSSVPKSTARLPKIPG